MNKRLLSPDSAPGAAISAASTPAVPAAAPSSAPQRPASPLSVVTSFVAAAHGLEEPPVEEAPPEGGGDPTVLPEGGTPPAAEVPAGEEAPGAGGGAEGENGGDGEEGGEGEPKPAAGAETVETMTVKLQEAQTKLEAAETRMQEAEANLATAQRPVLAPSAADPLSHVFSPQGLTQMRQQAQEIIEFCEMNPEGATVKNDKGEDVTFTAEQIRARRIQARRAIDAIPQREQFLQQHATMEKEAQLFYGEMYDKSTPAFARAQAAVRGLPELLRIPNLSLTIGDALLGEELRAAAAGYVKAQGEAGKKLTYKEALAQIKAKVLHEFTPKPGAGAAAGAAPASGKTAAVTIPIPPKPGQAKPAAVVRATAPTGVVPTRAPKNLTAQARDNLQQGKATKDDARALILSQLPG